MPQLAPLPVIVPLLTATLLLGLSRLELRRLFDVLALLAMLITLGVCVGLVLMTRDNPLVYWFGGWEPRRAAALGIAFTIDPIGAALATLSTVLTTAALVFSWQYFETVGALFHVLMLALLAGLNGFCLTGDLFNLFVFLQLSNVAAFALTAYMAEERSPLQGGVSFAVTNSVGAVLFMQGLALLYGRTGALNLAQIGDELSAQTADPLVIVAWVLIVSALLINAAVVPFHFWMADAHTVAPSPVCVLISGAMVELPLYGVLRLYWTTFADAFAPQLATVRGILLMFGVATALVGGLLCFGQSHLKRLLAFSSVSHVGLLLVGTAWLTPLSLAGTTIYLLAHGLLKGTLFLSAGILLNRHQSIDELELHGRGRTMPGLAAIFILAGLGLAGMFPFGTFVGRALWDDAATQLGHAWLAGLFVVVSALTGGAVLRAAARIFFGWGSRTEMFAVGSKEEHPQQETPQKMRHVPRGMIASAAALLLLALAVGLVPPLRHEAIAAAGPFQDRAGYANLVLAAVPQTKPAPVPHAVLTLRNVAISLLGVTAAVGAAALALFHHRLPRRLTAPLRKLLLAVLRGLKSLHNGHVGDYVTWLTVGVALFAALSLLLLRNANLP